MGGVDLADMLIELYCTDHKSRKWYMRIFYWTIDVSIVNAWLLYKRHCKATDTRKPLSLLSFRMHVAEALGLRNANKQKRQSCSEDEASPNQNAKHPRMQKPVDDVRYDGVQHWPIIGKKRQRRRSCSKGFSFHYCSKCNVHLCLIPSRNCFMAFHTN